jgi:hypothetical protein
VTGVQTCALPIYLLSGWNIISLPVAVSDGRIDTLFPTAVSKAFGYQGSYTPQTILQDGPGYWLKMDSARTVTLTGLPATHDSIILASGWNIIGSISTPVALANISTVPPGIIISQFFGYNGSYFAADTIRPGLGYWVRVNQAGALILDTASVPAQQPQPSSTVPQGAGRLLVIDDAGKSAVLSFINQKISTPASSRFTTMEVPPLPPTGGFDVRFATNSMIGVIDPRIATDLPIRITGAQYPLTIRWERVGPSDNLALRVGGKEIAVSGSGEVRVAEPVRTLSLIAPSGRVLPAAYSLAEAYPNPFNPSTTIGFTLPLDSHVQLTVYNLIGQIVASLVDGPMPAGTHALEWTPKENASGVYLIRFTAMATSAPGTTYSRVTKVVLQK